ncbi:MAG: hypothetical protein OZX49_01024 [Immundisolibacter sp.]|nr:hypothetical protein [Immundisolibacter sp.]
MPGDGCDHAQSRSTAALPQHQWIPRHEFRPPRGAAADRCPAAGLCRGVVPAAGLRAAEGRHRAGAGPDHVRHGPDADRAAAGRRAAPSALAAAGHRAAVPDHADAGLGHRRQARPAADAGRGPDPGRRLSGRHGLERRDLSGPRRCGAVGGDDRRLDPGGAAGHALAHAVAGRCARGRAGAGHAAGHPAHGAAAGAGRGAAAPLPERPCQAPGRLAAGAFHAADRAHRGGHRGP